jgi:hypothetical protein
VSGGYIWTVGQGGFETTNKNLCVLWEHLPLPAYHSCEFQYVLVIAWTVVILTAAVWVIVSAARLISRVQSRRNRLFAHWLLLAIFVIGTGVSLVKLIQQYSPSLTAEVTNTANRPLADESPASAISPAEKTFDFSPTIYYESRSIKAPDGRETKLYETNFYVIVSNPSDDGKTLRNVQAEIRGYETPVVAAIRGSASDKIDLKHGQAGFFLLGRTVGTEFSGNFVGSTTYADDKLKQYDFIIASGTKPVFEVWSFDNVYRFGLQPSDAVVWKLTVLISAEDKKSRQVVLDVNPTAHVPVSYENGGQIPRPEKAPPLKASPPPQ